MEHRNGTPKVKANVTNGNLQRQVIVIDGIAGLVGTALDPTNIGKVQVVYSLQDAENKGYKEDTEPHLYRHISEFYQELGGSQELWVLGVEDTMTLTQAVTATNQNGLKKLLTASKGRISLVSITRNPDESYNAGTGFLDEDVKTALTAAKFLAQNQQAMNRPVRILLEGRVNDLSKPIFEPITAENTYCGIVLGGTVNDGSASVGVALARACKYAAHVKLGSGENGALSITSAFIGKKSIDEFDPIELDNFTNAGYIHYHTRDGISGYFFSVDKMAGTDDFHILVHGRLIDKAQRIATISATPFIETSVRITKDGTINEADAMYLEQSIKSQLLKQLGDQVSAVEIIIPTDQDLINTNTLKMEVKIQPLGYLTWIIVNLGLTKTI